MALGWPVRPCFISERDATIMRLGFGGDKSRRGTLVEYSGARARGFASESETETEKDKSESLSDVGSWLGQQQELGCASAWAGQLG